MTRPDASAPRTAPAGAACTIRRVLFLSQRRAERMVPPPASALISITDPGRDRAAIGSGWRAVLRVAFDDVDPVTFPGQDDGMLAIDADQVAAIAAFVGAQAASSRLLVVHCRHGVSRSAAVAKAIAEAVGAPFPAAYDAYNRFAYLALRAAVRYAVETPPAADGSRLSVPRPAAPGRPAAPATHSAPARAPARPRRPGR